MTKEAKVITLIAVVFLIGFGLLIWKAPGVKTAGPIDQSILVRENSHMIGLQTASASVVEFGDYQCPACGLAHPILKEVVDQYKDNPNFNFVFRNFPLPQHSNALIAAEAAEAAGAQGKFWEMHDALYENQAEWSDSKDPLSIFVTYAETIGLDDLEKFKTDVTAHAFADAVRSDMTDANSLFVNHTPTVYLNGEEIDSFNVQTLKASIDAALAK